MRNQILLNLAIIAITDSVKQRLWRPWDDLICAVRKLSGG